MAWGSAPPPELGWEAARACAGADINLFYAGEGETYTGRGWEPYCLACPVRAECLAHAMSRGEKFGVWGGFSPRARKALNRELLEGTVTWSQIESSVRRLCAGV